MSDGTNYCTYCGDPGHRCDDCNWLWNIPHHRRPVLYCGLCGVRVTEYGVSMPVPILPHDCLPWLNSPDAA